MANFMTYMLIAAILTISQSTWAELILSALLLVPILVLRVYLKHKKYNKMGKQLLQLNMTPYEEQRAKRSRVTLISFTVFIVAVSIYLSNGQRIGLPWIIYILFSIIYEKYKGSILKKGFMENGIYTGKVLIEWGQVQACNPINSRKKKGKKGFLNLEIIYLTKFYKHLATLSILEEQNGKVDKILKEKVRSKKSNLKAKAE